MSKSNQIKYFTVLHQAQFRAFILYHNIVGSRTMIVVSTCNMLLNVYRVKFVASNSLLLQLLLLLQTVFGISVNNVFGENATMFTPGVVIARNLQVPEYSSPVPIDSYPTQQEKIDLLTRVNEPFWN